MPRIAPAFSLQLLAAGMAMTAIAFAPPAEGPLPGSLVVEARASSLVGLAARHATLVVAAPPAACGAGR